MVGADTYCMTTINRWLLIITNAPSLPQGLGLSEADAEDFPMYLREVARSAIQATLKPSPASQLRRRTSMVARGEGLGGEEGGRGARRDSGVSQEGRGERGAGEWGNEGWGWWWALNKRVACGVEWADMPGGAMAQDVVSQTRFLTRQTPQLHLLHTTSPYTHPTSPPPSRRPRLGRPRGSPPEGAAHGLCDIPGRGRRVSVLRSGGGGAGGAGGAWARVKG